MHVSGLARSTLTDAGEPVSNRPLLDSSKAARVIVASPSPHIVGRQGCAPRLWTRATFAVARRVTVSNPSLLIASHRGVPQGCGPDVLAGAAPRRRRSSWQRRDRARSPPELPASKTTGCRENPSHRLAWQSAHFAGLGPNASRSVARASFVQRFCALTRRTRVVEPPTHDD